MASTLVRYITDVWVEVDVEAKRVVSVSVDDEATYLHPDQELVKEDAAAIAIAEDGEWPEWDIGG